ncbi:RAB11-binding protein RELCH homolog [Galendromus occidentalis]|uniref:RAB11-binding protein RELCH homolog n=1 Tax=Galendromus occidentalis TaxID=34638 RepID=A0AAJ6QP79_9ACAR|nr:RAB11-binding protein RELCH homolog [Galendromus occidentalis]
MSAEKPTESLGIEAVARFLLNEKLFLTALELYSESFHKGNEVPLLRSFFNNPGNFEQLQVSEPFTPLPRTSSVQTLESLDLTRFSEDGEGLLSEKVAVLEFELRKARDAIRSLRNNLTVVTESTPDAVVPNALKICDGQDRVINESPLLPHEQRALNYLVNEYLLQHNYKLTAITFAEEDDNQDQDFDDWDEVGLNISKPPNLGHLYRNYCRWNSSSRKTSVSGTSTNEELRAETILADLPDIVGHVS